MQPDAISLIYRIYIYNVWSFQLSNSSVPLARGIPWWPCRGVSKLTPQAHSLERHHRDPNPLAFCPWAWLHALDAGFWNTAWRCIYKLYHKSLRRGKNPKLSSWLQKLQILPTATPDFHETQTINAGAVLKKKTEGSLTWAETANHVKICQNLAVSELPALNKDRPRDALANYWVIQVFP